MYVLLGLVALWAISKALGRRVEKTMRESTEARAIRKAVAEVGHYDGTPEARQRALATFVDLAQNGPFDVGDRWSISDLADDCVAGLTPQSGPILLETAWTVIGAHRLSHLGGPGPATAAERERAGRATTLFTVLFADWTKQMVRTYRVGTPAGMRESQLRMALVINLLLDRCERFETSAGR